MSLRDVDVAASGTALYAPGDSGRYRADTLYLSPDIVLGSPASSRPAMRGTALLVHEATHALQDAGARAAMSRAVAETAAYLAQAVYSRIYGESFRAFSSEGRATRPLSAERRRAGDTLLDALERVAQRLIGSGGGRRSFHAARHV